MQGVLQAAASGLEDALLDLGEAREVGEKSIGEVSVEVLQVPVELPRRPVERRDVPLRQGGDAAPGVPEEVFPGRVRRGGPVGGDEGKRLARSQGVPPGDIAEAELLLLRQDGEGQRHGDGERAGIEARLQLGGEPAVDGEPLVDPALPVAEELAHRRGAEAVLIDVRGHDASLVHGTGCPPGGVRLQEPRLFQQRRGILDDHGDLPEAVLLPGTQPLEAVDHLVGPVGLLHHSDREGPERVLGVGAVPPEAREGGPDLLDADMADGVHGPSRARI